MICNVALVLLLTRAFNAGWVVFKNIEGLTIHVGLFYIVGLDSSQSTTNSVLFVHSI